LRERREERSGAARLAQERAEHFQATPVQGGHHSGVHPAHAEPLAGEPRKHRKGARVASFAEADYRLSRRILLRAKYDYSDVFRSSPGNASERYVLETDLTLVPFADLKLGVWSIVPETADNELRVIGMVHLYY